ncbi:MDR family oxidoreductase [Pseudoteredinibacter isoporae]|uniref:Putative YhdH/YhfP family quinone oxidoreductase n=1 Tax=Pseudoteredinibacter isoporae TaxID=570281 RepID=A0A7X0MWU9_9GAMM|nr:MDR family oxidoreductase [Pseudoteredinibacter isoporae]MBB6520217.1 putative YhdH/YhfP family quinone oxidoreductase [Pseudoteredinibacter isoporae]NHO85789.1 oxidoreductase [Pseudoteredinibacter isoporae]NIB25759.1 oxidoreductase [Pseudoteredinibacter isoporae]
MSKFFNAYMIREEDGQRQSSLVQLQEADLPDEEVLVAIQYSGLNYKDGLALCGQGIARRLPMVGGVDLVGEVVDGGSSDFKSGDKVLVNGWGLSELHWGGYSQFQRLKPDWLVRVPENFSELETMAIGTAGYTAMLCVMQLQANGVKPEDGEIVVTGAAGGVGSVAISLLSKLGYHVVASTGRPQTHDYLSALGATDFIDRKSLSEPGKPFQAERWAGGIDTVGDTTLANVLAQSKYQAVITCCGLAGGADLPASVLPFILRGVRLIGVDSVMAPQAIRQKAWDLLDKHLPREKLTELTQVEPMSKLGSLAEDIIAGRIRGRVVIDVNS